MKKITEGIKINLTVGKVFTIIAILSAVYTGGSKLWADKTEVEVLKNDVAYIKQDVGDIKLKMDFIHQAFLEASKLTRK